MPVRIIGMIGVTPPSSDATLHVIEGGLSTDYLTEVCARSRRGRISTSRWSATPRRRLKAFWSRCMPPTTPSDSAIWSRTGRGLSQPTLMARKIATFDHLTNGRLAVHIITGKTDEEQHGDGDFSPKAERYRRAAEYLELMKLAWASERAVRFHRRVLSRQGAASDVRPLQQPHPLLFFGGASRRRADDGRAGSATSTPSTPSR